MTRDVRREGLRLMDEGRRILQRDATGALGVGPGHHRHRAQQGHGKPGWPSPLAHAVGEGPPSAVHFERLTARPAFASESPQATAQRGACAAVD
jgi:hypothetical protein